MDTHCQVPDDFFYHGRSYIAANINFDTVPCCGPENSLSEWFIEVDDTI